MSAFIRVLRRAMALHPPYQTAKLAFCIGSASVSLRLAKHQTAKLSQPGAGSTRWLRLANDRC